MAENSELLHKFGLRQAAPAPMAIAIDPEMENDAQGRCFDYLRGVRDRAANLELVRIKEGDTVSFPYSWMGPTRYHPSLGIMLLFCAGEMYGVRIRGRNLNAMHLDAGISLYDRGIVRHRVTMIGEMSAIESKSAGDGQCVVDRIEIMPVAHDEALKFLGL